MRLYMAPFACSLASHIALREAELVHELVCVSLKTLITSDGRDLRAISPMGQVPVLETNDGHVITQGAAVLQFIAAQNSKSNLIPDLSAERYEVLSWVNFCATELHKQFLWPSFATGVPEDMKRFLLTIFRKKLGIVEQRLESRDYLVGSDFTIADAYLVWVVVALRILKFPLDDFPSVLAYYRAKKSRPHIATALALEQQLV